MDEPTYKEESEYEIQIYLEAPGRWCYIDGSRIEANAVAAFKEKREKLPDVQLRLLKRTKTVMESIVRVD